MTRAQQHITLAVLLISVCLERQQNTLRLV